MERADPHVGRDAWATDGFTPVPGDVVALPGDTRGTVETVYLCAESSAEDDVEQVTRWSWIVLSDGRLLEVAPRGCSLYDPPSMLQQGSGPFLDLVAQDGALVRFEERVRAGTWEARPVRLTFEQRRWRATSTGTVTAHRLGQRPAGGWGQIGERRALTPRRPETALIPQPPGTALTPQPPLPVRGRGGEGSIASVFEAAGPTGGPGDAGPDGPELDQDVYFTLADLADPDALGLGVWATDICLAFGRRLGDTPMAADLRVIGPEQAADAPDAG